VITGGLNVAWIPSVGALLATGGLIVAVLGTLPLDSKPADPVAADVPEPRTRQDTMASLAPLNPYTRAGA